jgi:hypothetical protein
MNGSRLSRLKGGVGRDDNIEFRSRAGIGQIAAPIHSVFVTADWWNSLSFDSFYDVIIAEDHDE